MIYLLTIFVKKEQNRIFLGIPEYSETFILCAAEGLKKFELPRDVTGCHEVSADADGKGECSKVRHSTLNTNREMIKLLVSLPVLSNLNVL